MNIDIIPNGAIKRVHVSQNDVGRTLTFELFNNSTSYNVPSGAVVKIQGTKPSGFGFSETCTVSGNVATIDTTEAMTGESGNIQTELSISYDDVVIGTSNFVLAVEKNPHPSNTTDGTQITAQSLQVQINELADSMDAVEDVIDSFELFADSTNNKIKRFLLTDNVIYSKASETVSGTGNYVYKDLLITDNFSEGDYFCFSAESVTNATASQPFQIRIIDGNGNVVRSFSGANPYCTILASDITGGASQIVFRLYPAQGTALSSDAVYTNIYIVSSGTAEQYAYADALDAHIDDIVDTATSPIYDVATKKVVQSLSVTKEEGYVNKSGTTGSPTSYYHFIVDNLKQGDIVAVRTYYQSSSSIVVPTLRFVCAYNGNTVVTSAGVDNAVGQYTVPANITKIAITITTTNPNIESVLLYRNQDVVDLKTAEPIESATVSKEPMTIEKESMSESETWSFTANSIKKGKDYIFNANITTFASLTIGQGGSDNNGEKIVIDSTNLSVTRGTATAVTNAHGLTFADYISVVIHVNEKHIATITISTNGGTYSYTTAVTWIGCAPTFYVTTGASTSLTDCVFSFVCEDVKKPVWIFGDSYVSYTSERWPYWLSQMGFDSYLLDGYAGMPTCDAMRDLNQLLNYGTPKYIVWALGMNDADSSAVNNRWEVCYNELIALCNKHGVTPILATIPNTPSKDNSYKNAIVTASGYDYIDFASAVGALSDTTWYTGMLSSDNVHPTEEGARAFASQVLKDFPRICIK